MKLSNLTILNPFLIYSSISRVQANFSLANHNPVKPGIYYVRKAFAPTENGVTGKLNNSSHPIFVWETEDLVIQIVWQCQGSGDATVFSKHEYLRLINNA